MLTDQEKKTVVALEKEGYSPEEINKVLKSLKDVQAGKVFSAEEAYKKLHAKRKVYAYTEPLWKS